jgi:hypothetical protein
MSRGVKRPRLIDSWGVRDRTCVATCGGLAYVPALTAYGAAWSAAARAVLDFPALPAGLTLRCWSPAV